MTSALDALGKAFTPKKFRPKLSTYLQRAGVYNIPYTPYAILVLISIIIAVAVFAALILPIVREWGQIFVFISSFVAVAGMSGVLVIFVILVMYFYFDMKIYARTREMEKVLPDYLQVVSTNLKGGMSFERSLFAAIRPEFGVLSHEMTVVSKKVLTGHDLPAALETFVNAYDSPQLKRSFNLIVGEVTTGGKIAYVIDEVIGSLKETARLKAEMSASVITYVIFIGAIVVVIAPALFALSFHLLKFMAAFTDKLADSGASSGSLPFSFEKGAIKPESFQTFSWIATLVVAFFSAMIVSIIEKGNIRGGIKYLPLFGISSMIMYFIFMSVLNLVFSGLTF